MPGPCVVEIVIERMYVPFAVAGLSFISISSSARRFCASASGLNEALPNGVWMMPAFSTRNSTRPALSSLDRLRDVGGDRTDLRVRHQAARTEDAADLTDLHHHVRRRDEGVELEPVLLGDLLDVLVRAREVGACFEGFLRLVGLRDDEDALGLAGTGGHHDRAADHLVGVLRVDAEANRRVDRLVPLGRDLELRG